MSSNLKKVKVVWITILVYSCIVFLISDNAAIADHPDTPLIQSSISQNNSDWVEMKPVVAPPRRYHNWGQTTYDSESDRIILFSGDIESGPSWFIAINDTWAYDYNSNTWENMTNEQMRNNGRVFGRMAYDSESDRIILFSGSDKNYMVNSTKTGETWSYDYNTNTWTNLTTVDGPPARGEHSMIYDEANDRIIIYGGMNPELYYENLIFYQDTWAYDYNTNTWTNMSPPVNPGPLIQPGYAYDSESDKTIIFGGRNQSRTEFGVNLPAFSSNDTWVYSYSDNNWTKMTPVNFPSRRAYGEMTYISDLDKVCLFGGIIPGNTFSDTWIYDYNTNTWTDMNSPSPPSRRYCHNLAYDSESKVVILFGGMSGEKLNDTWAYHYQANVPSFPRDLQATLINETVHLSWNSPKTNAGSAITEYVIYRGTNSDSLILYKTILGSETIHFQDTEVSKGKTYYYAVRAKNAVGESKSSNVVSITIPSSPSVPGFPLILISTIIICLAILRKISNKKNKK